MAKAIMDSIKKNAKVVAVKAPTKIIKPKIIKPKKAVSSSIVPKTIVDKSVEPKVGDAVKSEKKILKEQIAATLLKSFSNISKLVGEKKFNKKVKKASKILAKGTIKKPIENKAGNENLPA